MNKSITYILLILLLTVTAGCARKTIAFDYNSLKVLNREIVTMASNKNSLKIDGREGAGMVILNNLNFDFGTIDLALKGEDNPGKSFVGIAFNIKNDSTYEAIYFRPFNFRSNEKLKREHSIQYMSEPNSSWQFLRKNYEGKYEAEYTNAPDPDDWFEVSIKIGEKKIQIFDKASNTELLNVERLEKQLSKKIALWTGNNSEGEFRNVVLRK